MNLFVEEEVLAGITEKFKEERIKYICIANELQEQEIVPRLHIQILLNRRINTTKSFMAKNLGMHLCFLKLILRWS